MNGKISICNINFFFKIKFFVLDAYRGTRVKKGEVCNFSRVDFSCEVGVTLHRNSYKPSLYL